MTAVTVKIPSFGPTVAPKYNRVPVKFSYLRDEDVETQTFQVLDKDLDIGTANLVLAQGKNEDTSEALPALVGLITKYMDNKDGTPVRWAPVELAAKKNEDPPVKRFRGPDGKLHEWSKAEDFLKSEKGSSRRRWLLLVEDDEVSVDVEALLKLMEFVVEVAGKDRTRA